MLLLRIFLISICSTITGVSQAENTIALFFGKAFTTAGNVRLSSGNGDKLLFHDVRWTDESFKPPLYYGIRVTHWSQKYAQYGISLDFTHAKIYSNMTQQVRVEGERNGQTVDATETLGSTFQRLAMSHGYNFLTVNAMFKQESSAGNSVKPYIGLGAGIAVPHFEIVTDSEKVDHYRLSGPVLQGMLGMKLKGTPFVAEYKYSQGFLKALLPQGTEVSLQPSTHHLVGGFEY